VKVFAVTIVGILSVIQDSAPRCLLLELRAVMGSLTTGPVVENGRVTYPGEKSLFT
jgi:hypothetical protein